MADRDLESLLNAVAAGDRAAFRALFDATSAKLFAIAVRIVREEAVAEDVVQDAYLRVWERAGDYRPQCGAPLGWMAAIVRNRAIDVLRKRREVRAADAACGDGTAMGDATAWGAEPDPFALDERSAALEALLACLGALRCEESRAVLLAYYYGYTYEEIARTTSEPVSTLKSRVRRALIKLRDCLSDER